MRKGLEKIIKHAELEITDTNNVFKVRHKARWLSEISVALSFYVTLLFIVDAVYLKAYFESEEQMLMKDWLDVAILLVINLSFLYPIIFYLRMKKDFIEVSDHILTFRYEKMKKDYFFERGMRVKMTTKRTSKIGDYGTYYFREVEIHLIRLQEERVILFFLAKEKHAAKAKELGQFITNQINEKIKKNRY